MTNRFRLLLFTVALAATPSVYAVVIGQGYTTLHTYRDCTRIACTQPDYGPPTAEARFSTLGVAASDPNDSFIDREDNPTDRGQAATEAIAPQPGSIYPELKAFASSNPASRIGSVVTGVQRYQNIGSESIQLQLSASVDGIIDKEDELWEDDSGTQQGSFVASRLTLFANASGTIDTGADASNPFAAFAADACLRQVIDLSDEGCGSDPTLTILYSDSLRVTDDGAFDMSFDLLPDAIDLLPGQSIFLGGYVAAVGLNGGTADAFSTFRATFTDPESGATITSNDGLVPIARVPEPGTFGLLGFGLLILRLLSRTKQANR